MGSEISNNTPYRRKRSKEHKVLPFFQITNSKRIKGLGKRLDYRGRLRSSESFLVKKKKAHNIDENERGTDP